jgi:hypothetical protein
MPEEITVSSGLSVGQTLPDEKFFGVPKSPILLRLPNYSHIARPDMSA